MADDVRRPATDPHVEAFIQFCNAHTDIINGHAVAPVALILGFVERHPEWIGRLAQGFDQCYGHWEELREIEATAVRPHTEQEFERAARCQQEIDDLVLAFPWNEAG